MKEREETLLHCCVVFFFIIIYININNNLLLSSSSILNKNMCIINMNVPTGLPVIDYPKKSANRSGVALFVVNYWQFLLPCQ